MFYDGVLKIILNILFNLIKVMILLMKVMNIFIFLKQNK
jgi:hypothetical protein